jgi:ribose 5-phosphate isomerase B
VRTSGCLPLNRRDLVHSSVDVTDQVTNEPSHQVTSSMPNAPSPILIASDHAGFALKEALETELRALGYAVENLGPASEASTDYADYAHPLAARVSSGEVDRGVLLCGTGLGMSYTANRYPHVRAAVAWTPEIAALAREHNDANVLVLPARFVGTEEGKAILKAWLDTPFAGGRHARRIAKIERDAATDTSTEESR